MVVVDYGERVGPDGAAMKPVRLPIVGMGYDHWTLPFLKASHDVIGAIERSRS